MKAEIRKFDYIDALRGYAVLGVVCVHSLLGRSNIPFTSLFGIGAKGVQLFYIVSSLTLYLSYTNRKNEIHPNQNFFIRRFFRIAPMFYLAILYYLWHFYGEQYALSDYKYISSWSIISHFLLLHALSPYWENSVVPGGWSVGVEILFYAICPLLFRLITSTTRALVFYIATFLIGQLLYIYFEHHPLIPYKETWNGYLYSYLPTQLPVFAMGIISFFVVKSTTRNAIKIIGGLSIFLILIYLSQWILNSHDIEIKLSLLNNMFFGIFFIIIIFILSKYNLPAISNTFVRYLGKISFSMYLTHFAVIYWLEKTSLIDITPDPLLSYLTRLTVILFSSVIVSTITYNVIEIPFQKIGKSIIKYTQKTQLS